MICWTAVCTQHCYQIVATPAECKPNGYVHQGREYVGVQDDHGSNSAGATVHYPDEKAIISTD